MEWHPPRHLGVAAIKKEAFGLLSTKVANLLLQIFKTMEKSEFRVLIKHCFLIGKIMSKQRNGLISVIQTQRLRGGMLTLNAVVQTQMILNDHVTQILQLYQKTLKKLHKLVLANRKLKLGEIAEELKISEGSVFPILHEYLSNISLCILWCVRIILRKKEPTIENII